MEKFCNIKDILSYYMQASTIHSTFSNHRVFWVINRVFSIINRHDSLEQPSIKIKILLRIEISKMMSLKTNILFVRRILSKIKDTMSYCNQLFQRADYALGNSHYAKDASLLLKLLFHLWPGLGLWVPTLPQNGVNLTSLSLWVFQHFWSFVTKIRNLILSNKF